MSVNLHTDEHTNVRAVQFEHLGQMETSLEIGSVTIFATAEGLQRIAAEAQRAVLLARGWTEPGPPRQPEVPEIAEAPPVATVYEEPF